VCVCDFESSPMRRPVGLSGHNVNEIIRSKQCICQSGCKTAENIHESNQEDGTIS
jgi:hypothetical protein